MYMHDSLSRTLITIMLIILAIVAVILLTGRYAYAGQYYYAAPYTITKSPAVVRYVNTVPVNSNTSSSTTSSYSYVQPGTPTTSSYTYYQSQQ